MTTGTRRRGEIHSAALSRREALLFEAGIKLGGVFHQYLGTPVSPLTSTGLARAIETALELQPYVQNARVSISFSRAGRPGRGRFHYHYLMPPMLRVSVTLQDGPLRVRATLAHDAKLRYPLMRVVSVGGEPRGATRKPRRRSAA